MTVEPLPGNGDGYPAQCEVCTGNRFGYVYTHSKTNRLCFCNLPSYSKINVKVCFYKQISIVKLYSMAQYLACLVESRQSLHEVADD